MHRRFAVDAAKWKVVSSRQLPDTECFAMVAKGICMASAIVALRKRDVPTEFEYALSDDEQCLGELPFPNYYGVGSYLAQRTL